MPVKKRSVVPPIISSNPEESIGEEEAAIDEDQIRSEDDDEESDGIPSDPEQLPEWTTVDISAFRKEVQCPICLGIIRKTRTVMECGHRFCRECIEKCMRLGNNHCPTCRTHCPTRRSLRDDPNFDNIISQIFEDIDKYEEEEFTLHEEDKALNLQIQEFMAQIHERQSASGQGQRGNRRRRRSRRGSRNQHVENEPSESNQNDQITHSESERGTVAHVDGGCINIEREREARKELRGTSPSMLLNAEGLSWGVAAARSHARHGNDSKSNMTICVPKLVHHLNNLKENESEVGHEVRTLQKPRGHLLDLNESEVPAGLFPIQYSKFDIHIRFVSFNEERTEDMNHPRLCCSSRYIVNDLREYVARETPMRLEDVELVLIKETHVDHERASTSMGHYTALPLEGSETLADLYGHCNSTNGDLTIAYQKKNAS